MQSNDRSLIAIGIRGTDPSRPVRPAAPVRRVAPEQEEEEALAGDDEGERHGSQEPGTAGREPAPPETGPDAGPHAGPDPNEDRRARDGQAATPHLEQGARDRAAETGRAKEATQTTGDDGSDAPSVDTYA